MNYYLKKINSYESKIHDDIYLLKKSGKDVTDYEEKLNSILNQEKTLNNNAGSAKALKDESHYLKVFNELVSLKNDIDSNQKKPEVFFRIKTLKNNALNCNSFESSRLDIYIDECKALLKTIDDLKVFGIDESKMVLKEAYSAIYEVIKLELIASGESKVLTYIKNRDEVEFINDLVREDILNFSKLNIIDESINKMVDELCKKGLEYSLADEDLILAILLKTDRRCKSALNNQIQYYENIINNLNKEKEDYRNNASSKRIKMRTINELNHVQKVKSIISAIILAISFGSFKLAPKAFKSMNSSTSYKYISEVYDTISDKERYDSFVTNTKNTESNTLIVYYPVNENGKRKVVSYKLNDKEKNIKELVDLNQEGLDIDSNNEIKYNINEQLSRDEYRIVSRLYLDETIEDFDEEQYNKEMSVINTILIAIMSIDSAVLLYSVLRLLYNSIKYIEFKKLSDNYDKIADEYIDGVKKYEEFKKEVIKAEEVFDYTFMDHSDYKKLVLKK